MIIKVKAFPKSKVNRIEDFVVENDYLSMKVRITAVPDKGQANKAIIELLADFLNVAKSSIELLRGDTCRNKTFHVVI